MGKGGMSHGENKDAEEVNMAAWLVGLNTLKIQPFELPSLGILFLLFVQVLYECYQSSFSLAVIHL